LRGQGVEQVGRQGAVSGWCEGEAVSCRRRRRRVAVRPANA
jgi:hypothetical protein